MKRPVISLLISSLIAFAANAVIAFPDPVTVTQPDGSLLTLIMHGDERCNFTTTTDGYTVTRSDLSGAWEYARLINDRLYPTGIVANNPSERTDADSRQLLSTPKMLRPTPTPLPAKINRATRSAALTEAESPTPRRYDYTKFRGLVILVEYLDCPFSRDDTHNIFNRMLNERNFTGFASATNPTVKIEYTGSVRDYYYENSMGLFDPRFDLIGPITVPYTKEYVHQVDNAQTLVREALTIADSLVNYADYDTDLNGEVDMVYFIFAGAGSNYTGNNTNLIWPHTHEVMNLTLDGVKLGRYACSTELYGRESSRTIDGIGTICHEFSHVLGLSDLYDVDYGTNGQAVHPANWSVMASGNYLNSAKTPCAFSLYERYAVGFTTPVTITDPGDYSLDYIGSSGTGYRIDSPTPDEYFLLENRLQTRWDKYLPGEGMLVFRVDSTDVSAWTENMVNTIAANPHYELLRANPATIGTSIRDSAGDPFPGSADITTLPLKSFNGDCAPLTLTDIALTADGRSTFTIAGDSNAAHINATQADPSPLYITVHGNMLLINGISGTTITAYDLTGRIIATAAPDPSGKARLALPSRGIYIVTDGLHTVKTAL